MSPAALSQIESNGIPVGLGFSCALRLCDGRGVDHEGKVWTDEVEWLEHQRLGVPSDYSWSDGLQKIFLGGNSAIAINKLPLVISRNVVYRAYWSYEFMRKERTLSYAFWFCIFNNDRQSKQNLVATLRTETNPYLQDTFINKYDRDLDLLYGKMKYFDAAPEHAFWFCVCHDLWYLNQDVPVITENRSVFDIHEPTSLAWNYVDRPALEAKLDELQLLQPTMCGMRKNWFTPALLDSLYARMLALKLESERGSNDGKPVQILVRSASQLDTRVSEQPNLPVELIRQASLNVDLNRACQFAEFEAASASSKFRISPSHLAVSSEYLRQVPLVVAPSSASPVIMMQPQYVNQPYISSSIHSEPVPLNTGMMSSHSQPDESPVLPVSSTSASEDREMTPAELLNDPDSVEVLSN